MAKNRKRARRSQRRSQKGRLLQFALPIPGVVRSEVEALLEDDRPAEALDILEEWLAKRPNHPVLCFYAGCAHAMLGASYSALRYFRMAFRADPRNQALLPNLMRVYLELDFTTHALRVLRLYLRTDLVLERRDRAEMAALRADLEQLQREAADYFSLASERYEENHYWDEEGQIAQQEGDWNGSITAFNKALKVLPDHSPTLNNRAMSYFYSGYLDEAIADEERVLKQDSGNVHALTNLTRFHYLRDDKSAMERYFGQLQALAPDDWSGQFNPIAKMLEAYAVAGTDEEIYTFLKQHVDAEPGRGYYMLGAAAANLGQRREARRAWRKVEEEGEAWKKLADDALRALAKGKPGLGRADRFPYTTFYELISQQQIQQVLAATEAAVDEPDQQRVAVEITSRHPGLLAAARWFLWYADEAMMGIQMLAMLGTEDAFAELRDFALGQAGTDSERLEAAQRLSQAGRLPTSQPLRLWLKGEWREIVLKQFEITEDAISPKVYSDEVLELLARAGQAYQGDDLEAAERLYERVLELDPRCCPAYNNLASIVGQQGDIERMRTYLEQSLEIDADYVMGRCNLARLHLDEGDVNGAEELLKPLLERERFAPFEIKAYHLVQAHIHIERNDLEGAASILEMLTQLAPDDPQVEHLATTLGVLQPLDSLLTRMNQETRKKRQRDDARPLGADASLESCLARHTKDALMATARLLRLTGVSGYRKGQLVETLAAYMRDPEVCEQVLAELSGQSQKALDYLLERGGIASWEAFTEHYGNDREESPYWQYREPQTTMGILRLSALLFVGKRDGGQWVQVPAELRPVLRELREK